MTFLPIVDRELRVQARQATLHWLRAALALMVGLLCLQAVSYSRAGISPAQGGRDAFQGLAWLVELLALSSALLTADCMTSERREGTLGLLLLTNLRGYDVVLGKLFAVGLAAFYGLLGLVPVFAIPLLAGGVTGGEVGRYSLAVLATLFFALATGVWASCWQRTRAGAIRVALAVVWGAALGAPVLGWLLVNHTYLRWLSPLSMFQAAEATRFATGSHHFWLGLAAVLGTSGFLLRTAARIIGRQWRTHETEPEPLANPPPNVGYSLALWRRSRQRMEVDPVRWLMSQLPGQQPLIWVAVALLLAPWLFNLILRRPVGPGWVISFSWPINIVTSFGSAALFAWLAARFFFELRRTGELELLMSTPTGARYLVTSQWRTWIDWLRGPMVVLVLLQLIGYGGMFGGLRRLPTPMFIVQVLNLLARPVNTILSVLALCAVGMWFGLNTRKHGSAVAWTVGLVSGIPWLTSLCLPLAIYWVLGVKSYSFSGSSPPFSYLAARFLPTLLVTGIYVFFIVWTRRKLHHDLRRILVEPSPVRALFSGRGS